MGLLVLVIIVENFLDKFLGKAHSAIDMLGHGQSRTPEKKGFQSEVLPKSQTLKGGEGERKLARRQQAASVKPSSPDTLKSSGLRSHTPDASLPKPYYEEPGIVIYCADCREILPLLPDKSVDLVLTDPPYGHNNNDGDLIAKREAALGRGESGPARPIANDGPEANELVRLLFTQSKRLLDKGCCCCCCCGGGPDPQFARWSLWMDEILGFKMCVVWDKGGLGMGWHYRRNWECVLVSQTSKWNGGLATPNVIRFGKIIPQITHHPTEKPVELKAFFVRLHSDEGETVLDPFMGSGTTLVAAKQLGRKAIGIEIEEKYCEIAVKRLAQARLQFEPWKETAEQVTLL